MSGLFQNLFKGGSTPSPSPSNADDAGKSVLILSNTRRLAQIRCIVHMYDSAGRFFFVCKLTAERICHQILPILLLSPNNP